LAGTFRDQQKKGDSEKKLTQKDLDEGISDRSRGIKDIRSLLKWGARRGKRGTAGSSFGLTSDPRRSKS